MKRLALPIAALGITGLVFWQIDRSHRAEWQKREADLLQEKDRLAAELARAGGQANVPARVETVTKTVTVEKKQSADEIIESLKTLRVAGRQTRNVRFAIQQFENLIALGPEALSPVKKFLGEQQDIEYDSSIFGAWKVSRDGNVPIDFVFPPSLRFGLFDVVRQIGGSDSESILADTLRVTGRGVEVAYLTRVLQQMAPFKYREMAVNAAKELLSSPATAGSTSSLDKYERNYLFGVLAFYNDASLAQQAQAGLVQADGKIDRGALQYLQNTLGTQAIPAIAQVYQDSRLADGKQKEPLARLALNFAGADSRADALWHTAINDPAIPTDARRELVEDLNQDGIQSEKQPTAADLKLIVNRLKLIEQFRNEADSKIMTDAFNEAEKDLKDMLAKGQQQQVK
jgi:hypothetical protein